MPYAVGPPTESKENHRPDPNIDVRTFNRSKRKHEAFFADEVEDLADGVEKVILTDEDLNEAVDTMLKAVMADYTNPPGLISYPSLRRKKPRLDPQCSTWSTCPQFLPFSEEYSSKFYKFMQSLSGLGIYPIKDVLYQDSSAKPCPIAMLDDPTVFQMYKNFKRLDTVVDFSEHLLSTKPYDQPSQAWVATIQKERRLLQEGLPDTIYVRLYESRMDLLTAVIIGAKGTPYHDGLFFFDVYYPPQFPLRPPVVRYRSGGFGINPHLFACGEFRFYRTLTLWSLLNPSVLQLLISIQNQVLNAEPLFHQPGFLDSGPSVVAKYFSLLYNEDTLVKSLKTMICIMTKPPKNFEAFVVGHFRDRARDILEACKAYRDGLQAGCVGRKEENYCSVKFRNDVNDCISQLVYHLNKIGATIQ